MEQLRAFLWFDHQAEQAVEFYQRVFPDLRIKSTTPYGPGMPEPEGTILTIDFELRGVHFVAMNARAEHRFTPAVSFMAVCEDQPEIDRIWNALLDGGTPLACGWITDRFGLTWQVTPRELTEWINDPDRDVAQRVMASMMTMIKLDLPTLRRAYLGEA